MATAINQSPRNGGSGYLKWILIGCGTLIVISIGVSAIIGAAWYFMSRSPNRTTGGSSRPLFSRSDVKLVDNHGFETVQKTWSSCTAFAPADWTIFGNEQRVGMGVDLASPDQTMFASYGIVGLPRTEAMLGRDYYGTGTPEKALQGMIESTGASGFELESASRQVGSYTLRYWQADYRGKHFRGFALYQAFESGDPNTYVVAYRTGSTEEGKWEQNKNLVYDVAASIRCTKHLFPVQESASREPKGSSKDEIEERLSTQREETTMGFQNVYSPSTGQHWEASYSDYNPTGPDGPGYYRRVGNSYEKLNEGFPPN